MADNETEEIKPAEEPVVDSMTGDQNFAYWLTMLPFIGIAIVFLVEFSKTPGEYNKLMNAGGALVVGIFIASLVNAISGEKKDEASVAESAKPEGSS